MLHPKRIARTSDVRPTSTPIEKRLLGLHDTLERFGAPAAIRAVVGPQPPLPEKSGLTLEKYLPMRQATGHPPWIRILRTLVANDELSTADLNAGVDITSASFHYHLDELVDVDLDDQRQRWTADCQGFYTYYRP